MRRKIDIPRYYTASEVAALFMVGSRTVARWDEEGRLKADSRTPGGHRRYNADRVDALLREGGLGLGWAKDEPPQTQANEAGARPGGHPLGGEGSTCDDTPVGEES